MVEVEKFNLAEGVEIEAYQFNPRDEDMTGFQCPLGLIWHFTSDTFGSISKKNVGFMYVGRNAYRVYPRDWVVAIKTLAGKITGAPVNGREFGTAFAVGPTLFDLLFKPQQEQEPEGSEKASPDAEPLLCLLCVKSIEGGQSICRAHNQAWHRDCEKRFLNVYGVPPMTIDFAAECTVEHTAQYTVLRCVACEMMYGFDDKVDGGRQEYFQRWMRKHVFCERRKDTSSPDEPRRRCLLCNRNLVRGEEFWHSRCSTYYMNEFGITLPQLQFFEHCALDHTMLSTYVKCEFCGDSQRLPAFTLDRERVRWIRIHWKCKTIGAPESPKTDRDSTDVKTTFSGHCTLCLKPWMSGERITGNKTGWFHVACAEKVRSPHPESDTKPAAPTRTADEEFESELKRVKEIVEERKHEQMTLWIEVVNDTPRLVELTEQQKTMLEGFGYRFEPYSYKSNYPELALDHVIFMNPADYPETRPYFIEQAQKQKKVEDVDDPGLSDASIVSIYKELKAIRAMVEDFTRSK